MRGHVVREKLHGRTAQGTWVQLEKTPAAFGQRKLPSLDDVRHLMDYVVYRVTRSNVGPWGLSRRTERRPLYLSPDLAVPTPLSPAVAGALATALGRIEAADDVTSASADLAARFPPPERADPGTELGRALDGRAGRPEGMVAAVVELVGTGPVLLGAYTAAELTAVDAIVDFLEARPSDEVVAEAVRSLAARQLLVAGSADGRVQVRGDLGIAVAFQQRSRLVLDARGTGTLPGEPWRVLLPQPEPICLVVRIDALGVHEIGLYRSADALDRLTEWLPAGEPAGQDPSATADDLLAEAERAALVTATRYTTQGSAEIAGASSDLVLARRRGQLYVLGRDPDHPPALLQRRLTGSGVRDTIAAMLA